ncbi:DNA polymerase delta catalytic subunit, partial [Dictyocoela roeselum]
YQKIRDDFDKEVGELINDFGLDSFSDNDFPDDSKDFNDLKVGHKDVNISKSNLKNINEDKVKDDLKDRVKNDLKNDLKDDFKDDLKDELNDKVKDDLKDRVKNDLKDEIKDDLKDDLNDKVKDDLKDRVKNDLKTSHETINIKTPARKILKIKTNYSNIIPIPLEGEYSLLPKMKILSFDIEVLTEKNIFPDAKRDPIIQIGNTISYGSEKRQAIFCYKECAPIPGVAVYNFESEIEMIRAWGDYVQTEDPDIIIGYNIKDFDIPYILARAKNIKGFHLGRNLNSESADTTSSALAHSKQSGIFGQNNVNIEGRLIFDMIQIIRRDFKLHSYTLNSVSVHFLNEQKEDLPYYFIEGLWRKGPEHRARIATYCLKDTYLPLRLFEKLNILFNYSEIARVTGIPIEFQMTRGTSIKVFSLILRKAKEMNYMVPTINAKGSDESYEGAFVMDPQRGFYNMPVAVLDFASLYPSIIIAFNLCYSTFLTQEQVNEINLRESMEDVEYEKSSDDNMNSLHTGPNSSINNTIDLNSDKNTLNIDIPDITKIKKKDIYISPTNSHFVKSKVRKGILPEILEFLIEERRKVKKMMKTANSDNYNILNGRQLALKIAANSLYGFTGSTIGLL